MHWRLEEKKTGIHRVLQNSRYHLKAEYHTGRSGKAVRMTNRLFQNSYPLRKIIDRVTTLMLNEDN